MKKQKIAVIFGGNSTEYEVSLQSATAVLKNINSERFDILPIGINRAGDWFSLYRENMKALQTILGLKIAPKTPCYRIAKPFSKGDFLNFPKSIYLN